VQQTKILFVLTCSISCPVLTSAFLTLQLSVYPTSHMTSSHSALVTYLPPTYHTDLVNYQMLLTFLLTYTFSVATFQKLILRSEVISPFQRL